MTWHIHTHTVICVMRTLTLRAARKRARMTQDVLAAKSGVDQTTISSLEIGRSRNPNYSTVKRLSLALGIDPAVLRFDDAQRSGGAAA